MNGCRLCLVPLIPLLVEDIIFLVLKVFDVFVNALELPPLKTNDNVICSLNSLIYFYLFSVKLKRN